MANISATMVKELRDKTGSVGARLWNASEQDYRAFENGDYVFIDGATQLFQGNMQMIANSIRRARPDEVDEADFTILQTGDIDYVNLHGTGTPSNDASEDQAVHGLFGDSIPVNSTKGMTGHTLGAAGAVEAVVSVLAIEEGRVPGSPGTRTLDPQLRARYEIAGAPRDVRRVLSNSFGFGGSNCSLVFGRLRHAA